MKRRMGHILVKLGFCLVLLSMNYTVNAQEGYTDDDALFIKSLFDKSLSSDQAYLWLEHLSENIGGRLSGSSNAAKAVQYTKMVMDTLNLSRTWLQNCQVPVWQRGEKEEVKIIKSPSGKKIKLNACALGYSGATNSKGIQALVIEVKSLEELEKLPADFVKGKIVFFNRPMSRTELRTFQAYGGAVDQRVFGPQKAMRKGAVAALIRSMTTQIDEYPHTGTTQFDDNETPIPAISISTRDAELLSKEIRMGSVQVFLKCACRRLPDAASHNVIGEIKGSSYPNEIMVLGGHLDSWDLGGGAHDDGAGCVQSIDVLRLFKEVGYQPKHTIRAIMYMNEENGLAGGKAYGEYAKNSTEKHIVALESDAGGFTPRGISCEGDDAVFLKRFKKMNAWNDLLEPYDMRITKGGSGADISTLKPLGTFMMGLRPDSQRYFDYHHTSRDRISSVNQRELALGTALIASVIYLIDKYGLE